uniref:Protein kinase domain-containing protein n=1 Tax=Ciona savignyi TaxID=51511 RepID=H2YL44_CIOSA
LCVNNKNYLVLKQLGEGGSSKVSQVFCLQSKTTMAVKQVSLKGADEPTKNEFKNEIEFLMKLRRNPYIVHLYDYQLTNDHIFLVLECGSTDLAKLIQSRKSQNSRLEIYEIRYFWKKMLHAVNTIHQHGVIHRDLKPANFVFVEGHLKLIDFGISNSIQSDATSIIKETQCGTLNYMAPEAIMDMSGGYNPEAPQFKISPRADVWSLGCILYSMMYGRTPFQHIKHQMLKLNAITNPQHRIEFPEFKDQRLWKIVQNCLQRNPKNRATVEQLL